jgi:putative hemolysin
MKPLIGIVALLASILTFFGLRASPTSATPASPKLPPTPPPIVALANPASTFCVESGGTLTMKTNANGEYGVCTFPTGESCEEWALFRGECNIENISRTAKYQNSAVQMKAIFRIRKETALIFGPQVDGIELPVAPSGSGARYLSPDRTIDFWEHQGEATLTVNGKVLFRGTIMK